MTQICRKMVRFNLRRRFQLRVSLLRRCIRCFWEKIFMCSLGKPGSYRVLPHGTVTSKAHLSSVDGGFAEEKMVETSPIVRHVDSDDLVALKISVLGDCQTGKTSFLEKYIGSEIEHGKLTEKEGLNLMDKTLFVKGAFISYSIWEVEGDEKYTDHIPIACKDSVAICIMFDLTSRCTLNSVLEWYQKARKWNQTAIPVLIGTKFDDFIQLPIDLQWTIASQARAYAKALNATLFFSSATYNININKVFKFITAKLFDVPWTLERNLTIGEPIIDF